MSAFKTGFTGLFGVVAGLVVLCLICSVGAALLTGALGSSGQ